ncbi:N-acetylglucosamine-6-phosphate deacetylase [Thermoproteus uzoniensis 768-20]|uniref:N-acetylglucosamine-6-phosphate deacetylase n=1 Tax=Thermoproteus uzoniensis (strain 768-20) TaxID=999630 RepID=F2L1G3_THEU7|nr:N-acetylglucosamine-6-phosphate deacetylase [Thermoproteus uzoniensis]AEA11633.1 N-acetylglucosamine-6-phosphate deacetylase [Thermoproteus uzoniensis 768-20]
MRIRFDVLYTPYEELHDAVLAVEDGRVVGIGSGGPFDLDFRGYIAAPGLVDTHTHGCCGVDFTSSPERLGELAKAYLRYGVTSITPTTVTAPRPVLERALAAVRAYAGGGARVLGVHMEGPFINPARRGAQDARHIRRPDLGEAEAYISTGVLRIMTVAPELEGGLELVSALARAGVVPSVGHTDADYKTAKAAVIAGASRATHIFNAMRGFHHREPGPALALLESEHVYVEFIADFVHLAPEVVRVVVEAAGHRAVAVTDSIAAAGLGDGVYRLGGVEVRVEGPRAFLEDGTIAGSVITLDQAVRNLISLGVDPRRALAAATTAPARSVGRGDLGCLRPGCAADIAVFDRGFKPAASLVGGQLLWSLT